MNWLLELTLPEPPSLNAMLGYAKAWGRGRKYYKEQQDYRALALEWMNDQGLEPPDIPWERWELVSAHFRLHNPRDPIDLLAGTKWGVDLLIDEEFIEDDSARHVTGICLPTQEVDRKNRGVDLVIRRTT